MPLPRSRTLRTRTHISPSLLVFVLLCVRACRTLDIAWTSPTAGDVYEPGAYILGEWNSTTPIASPYFQLCIEEADSAGSDSSSQDPDNSCGAPIQPSVQQDSDTGLYQVTLAAPNVTQSSEFYLALVDSAGDMSTSPVFTLASTPVTASAANPSANTSTPQFNAPAAVSGASGTKHTSQQAAASQPQPFNMEQTLMPAPTAAYAVPLSIAGAVILLAGVLGIHHHRALVRERAAEKERLARSAGGPAGRANLLFSCPVTPQGSMRSMDEKDEKASVRDAAAAADDIYTRIYVPRLSSERHAQRHLHAHAQPRQTTREPFASPVRPAGHGTTTAGLFRSTLSPRMPHLPSDHEPTRQLPPHVNEKDKFEDGDRNASMYDSVVSHYLQPSPVPANPASPANYLTPVPPRLAHVRKSTSPSPSPVHRTVDPSSDPYYQVARKLSGQY